jgi:hypothetical protein
MKSTKLEDQTIEHMLRKRREQVKQKLEERQ